MLSREGEEEDDEEECLIKDLLCRRSNGSASARRVIAYRKTRARLNHWSWILTTLLKTNIAKVFKQCAYAELVGQARVSSPQVDLTLCGLDQTPTLSALQSQGMTLCQLYLGSMSTVSPP